MSIASTFASDFAFGEASEKTNHTILERIFKCSFTRRGGKATFDFDNIDTKTPTSIHAELKTRRINHNRWPTAIIGANKVEYASRNPDTAHWFVYNYLNGIYGIKYSKEKFDTYEHSDYQRSARSDTNNNAQHCYFIPYTDLTRFDL